MYRCMNQLARLVVLGMVVSLAPPPGDRCNLPHPHAVSPSDPSDAAAQVRLRKLHLVRPDLIPFPISFEVYA
jgi:hypothetical protein